MAEKQITTEVISSPVTEDDIQSLIGLVGQLTSSDSSSSTIRRRFDEVLESESQHLYAARCLGRIVGIAIVTEKTTLSHDSVYVDDVVVDASMRGRGVGGLITNIIIADYGGHRIDLTTSRAEARQMYEKYGFKARETTAMVRQPDE